jgi:hypothetical protein
MICQKSIRQRNILSGEIIALLRFSSCRINHIKLTFYPFHFRAAGEIPE